MECKDIPDKPILEFLYNKPYKETHGWAVWFIGFDNSINQAMGAIQNEKLIRAKMKTLIKRGLVDGCTCGCRGDYEITEKGCLLLEKLNFIPKPVSQGKKNK